MATHPPPAKRPKRGRPPLSEEERTARKKAKEDKLKMRNMKTGPRKRRRAEVSEPTAIYTEEVTVVNPFEGRNGTRTKVVNTLYLPREYFRGVAATVKDEPPMEEMAHQPDEDKENSEGTLSSPPPSST